MPISESGILSNPNSIKASATLVSGNYEYERLSDGAIRITKFNGNSGDIVIPDTIDGGEVTAIGESAFEYCKYITSVTIPKSVNIIECFAFYGCST